MVLTAQNLGSFLRAAREGFGLSLRSVEDRTGISNAYLSQLEHGRIRQPSPVILHKLSELYGCSYADVMRLAGYPLPPEVGGERDPAARARSRFADITQDEERQLAEYLEFIRSRRGPGGRR